jgi:hypothetical protein
MLGVSDTSNVFDGVRVSLTLALTDGVGVGGGVTVGVTDIVSVCEVDTDTEADGVADGDVDSERLMVTVMDRDALSVCDSVSVPEAERDGVGVGGGVIVGVVEALTVVVALTDLDSEVDVVGDTDGVKVCSRVSLRLNEGVGVGGGVTVRDTVSDTDFDVEDVSVMVLDSDTGRDNDIDCV